MALAAATVAGGLASTATHAATATWNVDGGGDWSLGTNWNPNTAPNAVDDIANLTNNLSADAIVNLDISVTLGQLNFGDADTASAAGWTVSGANSLFMQTSAGVPVISVGALGTGEVANISAAVFGTQGLDKQGAGALVLTGNNGWSGGTTISGGTLQIGTGQATGADVATIGSGAIVNNGTLSIFKTNAYSINDNISGSGSLVKLGTGALNLGGTNSYTGTTTVSGGILNFTAANAYSGLGAGSITVGAGGAIGNGAASITDGTFLGRVNGASTGALALGAGDAATNLNFTSAPLSGLANMSVGANGNVVYTGTITPAGGTYRLGGGGGTLQIDSALASGNVVVGGGGPGTVIFNGANTYAGTTTINPNSHLQIGALGGTTGALGTGDVTNNGELSFIGNNSQTIANNISGNGMLSRRGPNVAGNSTTTLTGTVTIGALNIPRSNVASASPGVEINGGTFTSNALSFVNGGTGAGRFILTSGSATFNGGLVTDNNDGAQIRVNGGTFTATDMSLARTGGTTNPTFPGGFAITAGTANFGTITLGRPAANSWGVASFDGGDTTVTGAITIGQTTNAGRGGAMRVTAGTFTSTDAANGLVMGRSNGGTTTQQSRATFSGGIATFEKISMGFDNTLIGGNADVNLQPGGTIYLGSGGIVKNSLDADPNAIPAIPGHNARMNFSGGTLGAKASWSAHPSVQFIITGTTATVQAADASNNPFNITWNGNVSGAGPLAKTGGGTLALYGNNASYSGTISVNAGTLQGSASGMPATVVNGGAVVFDQQGSDGTYTGMVSGAGSLSKIGTGTITLANPQTYSGATTISGGSLVFKGAQATSGVTVGAGAGIGVGSGGATLAALTLDAGSHTLRPNNGTGIATINVTNNNGLIANGSTLVDLGIVGLTPGTHTLLDYVGTLGGTGFSTFSLGALPLRTSANLINNVGNTSVDVNVVVDLPRWHGGINNVWDINTTQNWREVFGGNPTTYLQPSVPGDQVLFNDDAIGNTSINISTTVQPTKVTVNNGSDTYTFGGTGKISGPTGVFKQGTGTLILNPGGGHDYTGGTFVENGVLQLGGSDPLPQAGNITVSGGTFNLGGNQQQLTGNFALTGGTLSNGILFKNGGPAYDLQSGVIAQNARLDGVAGTGLTKSGTGTVTTTGQLAITGQINVTGGTLRLGDGVNDGALPGSVASNTGTVEFNTTGDVLYPFSIYGLTGTVVKSGPGTLTLPGTDAGNGNEGNAIVNEGTVVLQGVITSTNPTAARLGRGGVITINNGATVKTQNVDALGLNTALLPANLQINAGGTFMGDAGSETAIYNIGMAGGTLTADPGYVGMTLRGDITATGGVTSTLSVPSLNMLNGPVFSADAGSTLNITGDLSSPDQTVTKSGDGTVIFATTKSYQGQTGVTGGKLLLQTPHLNSSSLAVTNNAVVEVAVDGTQNNLIRTPAITVSGTARIDLKDNKLITSMAAGTWNGTNYTDVAGLVDSGRGPAGNALWDGSGIVTSDTRAINNGDLVSIGVAKISEVRTVADTETTTFAGQNVLGSDAIAMVTWGGDANLDGKINIDDYGRIDGNVGQSGAVFGWSKGDFNYDGKINIDDYGIIDGNINRQGAVFATSGGAASAGLEGVAAVPEPAGLSLLAAGAMGLLRRRRRAQ